MNLQVLVVTMDQKDHTLPHRMNLGADAIIGHQCDHTATEQEEYRGHTMLWLSTADRGVGLNRNQGLMHATADLCLLSDDDVIYADGVAERVCAAFEACPQADVLVFGMEYTRGGQVFERVTPARVQRLHFWNAMKYGTCCVAVRNRAIQQKNLVFTRLFGGGCLYGSGEDSLFLLDCLRRGLKVYTYPLTLGQCAKDVSSWFSGFNEKYFYDKGAWLACAFPGWRHWLLKWYFILRYRGQTQLSLSTVRWEINRGIRGFRTLSGYTPCGTMAQNTH